MDLGLRQGRDVGLEGESEAIVAGEGSTVVVVLVGARMKKRKE